MALIKRLDLAVTGEHDIYMEKIKQIHLIPSFCTSAQKNAALAVIYKI